MKRTLLVVISLFIATASMAAVVFQDDFENNSGGLGGRQTDDGIATWETPQNMVVTNGVLVSGSGVKPGSGWISLPTLTTGDVLTVSAVVVGNVSVNSDWVGLGLTADKSALYTGGNPYVTLTRQSVGGNTRGKFTAYGGKGSGYQIDNDLYLQETGGFSTGINARNTVKFEYHTGTGNLKTWLISENGTEVLHYNGPVDYNGVGGAAVPLDQLKWLAVTLNTTEYEGTSSPAFIDDLIVSRVAYQSDASLYGDSFETDQGSLNNRHPDAYDTDYNSIALWSDDNLDFQITNGVLQTVVSDGQASAWLPLPAISRGDVIRASAVLVANGDANTDWLGIGLLQAKNHVYQQGSPYVTLTRRVVDPGANQGLVQVYGGLGNANGTLLSANYLKEQDGFTTNLNARNTVAFEYDTASGNLQVWMTSEGGTTVTQYNGSVDYEGVTGQAIPVEDLNYFGITFNNLTSQGEGNPAYIDNLVIDYIPAGSSGEVIPARIIDWSFDSNNLMRLVVDAPSAAGSYYPKFTANLVLGEWTGVAHSDDGVNAFMITNLNYASSEGTHKVIYLQTDDAVRFFGIDEQP